MIMEITVNKQETKFNPIEITIKIESQREFEAISHLMGASLNTLKNAANSSILSNSNVREFTHNEMDFTATIWHKLNP